MAYASWSVVFGEQPSATKWNILGTNDLSFNDGTGIADDKIHSRHIDWASTGAISGDNGGIWWEEIGRTTLGVAGDTISITSIAARKYLKILVSVQGTGGTISAAFRLNNDSSANYSDRVTGVNNGADTTNVSQTSALLSGATTYAHLAYEGTMVNTASIEKMCVGNRFAAPVAGAGNTVDLNRYGFKWANTSNQITRIDLINVGTGDYAIGSEVVVLGHN